MSSPSDTIKLIMDAHFESFTALNIDNLVESWGEVDVDEEGVEVVKNEEGKKQAILFIYKAVNDERASSLEFFEEQFCELLDKGSLMAKGVLNTMADQARGDMKDYDPLYTNCKRLSSIKEPEVLKAAIGLYFVERTNEYLKEKYKDIYEEISGVTIESAMFFEEEGDVETEISNESSPPATIAAASAIALSGRLDGKRAAATK